jgi:hypothetical protein
MAAFTVLGVLASKFAAPLIGTSPDFDRTCNALAVGRRHCIFAAALVNLAATMAPPGALTMSDVGSLGASTLLLTVWISWLRPVYVLREFLQPRRASVARVVTLAETALAAPWKFRRTVVALPSTAMSHPAPAALSRWTSPAA